MELWRGKINANGLLMIVTPSQEEEEIQSLLSLQCEFVCVCVCVWERVSVCVCGVCVIERGIDNWCNDDPDYWKGERERESLRESEREHDEDKHLYIDRRPCYQSQPSCHVCRSIMKKVITSFTLWLWVTLHKQEAIL